MTTIALYNIKGGVGKTATAVNLSLLSARDACPTLLFDLDPQGSASFYFRVKPRVKGKIGRFISRKKNLLASIKGTDYQDLDLLPSDFAFRELERQFDRRSKSKKQLRQMLSAVAGEYDFMFLDCPPGISLVSENVFRVADIILIPTVPTPLSVRTYSQVRSFFETSGLDITKLKPFFSMVETRKTLHRSILVEEPRRHREFLKSRIPYLSDIERMGLHREPVTAYAPRSLSALSYERLWKELKQRLP